MMSQEECDSIQALVNESEETKIIARNLLNMFSGDRKLPRKVRSLIIDNYPRILQLEAVKV